jgi:chemotaxis protein histidine kinase CheA
MNLFESMGFTSLRPRIAFGDGGGGGGGGSSSSSSSSTRPQARPSSPKKSGPRPPASNSSRGSGGDDQRAAEVRREVAAAQKREASKKREASQQATQRAAQQAKQAADQQAKQAKQRAAQQAKQRADQQAQQRADQRAAQQAQQAQQAADQRAAQQAQQAADQRAAQQADQAAVQKQTTERSSRIEDVAANQNSLYQRAANFVTPNDGKSYVGGELVGSEDDALPDRASTAPPVRPTNLDTSVSPTVYPSLDIDSDDNATRLAAANAADVAEDVRIQRLQNIARESGTMNSAYQKAANLVTPNDGKEYINGQLVESVGASRDSLQGRGMNNAPGMLGQGQTALNYLSGARADDLPVGYVDGQRIYERANGTTYTVNSIGLVSDTAGPDTLDPRQDTQDQSNSMMYQQRGGTDRNVAPVEEVEEEEEIEPCPEGYMLDPETQTCIIDPFQIEFPDANEVQTTPMPQMQPNSAYTAANPMAGLPSLSPVQQSNFAVPTPTVQPITVGQQGLASLPPRMG